MAVIVYYSPGINADVLVSQIKGDAVTARPISVDTAVDPNPKILVVDQAWLEKNETAHLQEALGVYLLVDQERDFGRLVPEDVLMDYSVGELNVQKLRNFLHSALLKHQAQVMRAERDAYLKRLKELNKIGVALSTERDPNKLLNMILQKSREVTSADAGSLYLVEGDEETGKNLRFKISQNDSMTINYQEYVMPITKNSIAGYVAIDAEPLNITDVYRIGSDCEYAFNRNFDESTGYRTISMLTVPMANHKGQIIGIIQLINRKKDFKTKLTRENCADVVQAFDQNDVDLVSSLTSQAAVALENSILIKSIERLFEGFVTAAVTAIESRDPTTSGHSFRVADLTVGLAELVDRVDIGNFRNINFSQDQIKEIRYASLLHDFGKVGVRENVLVKAKKLYPLQLELIRERFRSIQYAWEADFYKSKLNLLQSRGAQGDVQAQVLEAAFRQRMNSLEDYLHFIIQANEPSVLAQGNFEKLIHISGEKELVPPEIDSHLLTPEEVQLLSIRKGSLNDSERVEIESHVTHTFLFLSKIPWTSELKDVPRIAYGHHEKLNGGGYPNRLQAGDIPIQTRMMTISDIFDALTASDRPYKRAVPYEKALDIISDEVKRDQIDPELFQLFLEGKIYRLTTGK